MATDIMDKDLKVLRNNRWAKAFLDAAERKSPGGCWDRKATIVTEHYHPAYLHAHNSANGTVSLKNHAGVDGRSDKDRPVPRLAFLTLHHPVGEAEGLRCVCVER
jgi:hypothetical protein